MGWSCTMVAHNVMSLMTEKCLQSTHSQNQYVHNGKLYFWEGNHKEYADGRIVGEVFEVVKQNGVDVCLRAGKFTIDGRTGDIKAPEHLLNLIGIYRAEGRKEQGCLNTISI